MNLSEKTRLNVSIGTAISSVVGMFGFVGFVLIWIGVLVPITYGQDHITTEQLTQGYITKEKLTDTTLLFQVQIDDLKHDQDIIMTDIKELLRRTPE